jgi:formylglycine-generating enzyme required for sulfatase activity
MQLRLFTLPSHAYAAEIEVMNRSLRGHPVLTIQQELVQTKETAMWCLYLRCLDENGTNRVPRVEPQQQHARQPQQQQRFPFGFPELTRDGCPLLNNPFDLPPGGKNASGYQVSNAHESLPSVFYSDSVNAEKTYSGSMLQQLLDNMLFIAGGTGRPLRSASQGSDKPDRLDACDAIPTVQRFYLSRFPVTLKEWEWLMGYNPMFDGLPSDCPVSDISWNDALNFIQRLNAISGVEFRLPAEAEWEHAARGGTAAETFLYSGSDDADAVAWHAGNAGCTPRPVGLKKPNSLGLYDMSGNVCEWCADIYELPPPPRDLFYTDPLEYIAYKEWLKKETKTYRVLRGGSRMSKIETCLIAFRGGLPEDLPNMQAGFRLAADSLTPR